MKANRPLPKSDRFTAYSGLKNLERQFETKVPIDPKELGKGYLPDGKPINTQKERRILREKRAQTRARLLSDEPLGAPQTFAVPPKPSRANLPRKAKLQTVARGVTPPIDYAKKSNNDFGKTRFTKPGWKEEIL